MKEGPAADQPRGLRTPPGVGTPLRALGASRVSARRGRAGEKIHPGHPLRREVRDARLGKAQRSSVANRGIAAV
jgi:hypothetical protein